MSLRPSRGSITIASDPRKLAVTVAFTSGYVGMLAWFQIADVYHRNFFDVEVDGTYLAYSAFRTVFLAYFAWIHFFVGLALLRRAGLISAQPWPNASCGMSTSSSLVADAECDVGSQV